MTDDNIISQIEQLKAQINTYEDEKKQMTSYVQYLKAKLKDMKNCNSELLSENRDLRTKLNGSQMPTRQNSSLEWKIEGLKDTNRESQQKIRLLHDKTAHYIQEAKTLRTKLSRAQSKIQQIKESSLKSLETLSSENHELSVENTFLCEKLSKLQTPLSHKASLKRVKTKPSTQDSAPCATRALSPSSSCDSINDEGLSALVQESLTALGLSRPPPAKCPQYLKKHY